METIKTYHLHLFIILEKTLIVYKKNWFLSELANIADPDESDMPSDSVNTVKYYLYIQRYFFIINFEFVNLKDCRR